MRASRAPARERILEVSQRVDLAHYPLLQIPSKWRGTGLSIIITGNIVYKHGISFRKFPYGMSAHTLEACLKRLSHCSLSLKPHTQQNSLGTVRLLWNQRVWDLRQVHLCRKRGLCLSCSWSACRRERDRVMCHLLGELR